MRRILLGGVFALLGAAPGLLLLPGATVMAQQQAAGVDVNSASRFAGFALDCLHKEYPNKIAHVLNGDQDVKPPRELTPAFYGCYDWHSSVHGHWLLVRLLRTFPSAPFTDKARAAIAQSLTPQNIGAEVAYMNGPGRTAFERPYGLAWLLQLAAELREWNDPQAQQWSATLKPLEDAAAARLREWLPKLTNPIRIGEHDQTAFSFGLAWDWAATAHDQPTTDLLRERIGVFYLDDRNCPINYEPSGQDFLSPCLGEADLVRRVLPPDRYAVWLKAFLPAIEPQRGGGRLMGRQAPTAGAVWLKPAVVTDPSDPKLAHLDGLNLSRAWMLEGIASGLPANDSRRQILLDTARAHREAGLHAVTGEHYEGGHWLASFAVYLVTGRGLRK
jgi:hypothetical protein